MESYEKVEEKCMELKRYTKRVMDLYCDAKKWHWLAESAATEVERQKYNTIANALMDMFNKEISSMIL
jgi:hypothetical protein